jgi:hypothetical protein
MRAGRVALPARQAVIAARPQTALSEGMSALKNPNGDSPMPVPTRRLLLTSLFVALSGAAAAQPSYPPIPPPKRIEPAMPPTRGNYVWQPGHWSWTGYRYVWVGGAYVKRQPGWNTWVPGRWVLRGDHWVWIRPHWR